MRRRFPRQGRWNVTIASHLRYGRIVRRVGGGKRSEWRRCDRHGGCACLQRQLQKTERDRSSAREWGWDLRDSTNLRDGFHCERLDCRDEPQSRSQTRFASREWEWTEWHDCSFAEHYTMNRE